jgi:putative transposase
MARRKDSPQKAAMREMMRDYLKNNDISIKDGTDVNSIMRDMMSVLLEGALDEELDEELGYSKYDYRNNFEYVYIIFFTSKTPINVPMVAT